MTTDHIRFDILAQEALRGVVRRVLSEVSKDGLPGEHHFYISFDTRAPGVDISNRLHEQYPEDMTIVMQHQFWDLAVHEHHFEIGLSFSGVPEKLSVPFSAIKGFFDPSVQFGLQFDVTMGEGPDTDDEELTDNLPVNATLDNANHKTEAPQLADSLSPTHLRPTENKKSPAAEELSSAKTGEMAQDLSDQSGADSADIVSLDAFRKKPDA